MIKANELRIGNWISNGEKNFTVDANVIYDAASFEHYCENLEPIPLTADILVKNCRFDIVYHKERYIMFSIPNIIGVAGVVFLLDKDGNISENVYLLDNGITRENGVCKYVHQLQNLYFALIGIELEITL